MEAWSEVTSHDPPLAMKRAIASGFHGADQEELLSAYVQPYFDSVMKIWEEFEIEEALGFIGSMYPHMVITQDVVNQTDTWLRRGEEIPGPIKRSQLESQDDLKRAQNARKFNSSK